MFRAYDKLTGKIVWETEVPTGATSGLPITYTREGRQYIVFAAGSAANRSPAQLVAYALPE